MGVASEHELGLEIGRLGAEIGISCEEIGKRAAEIGISLEEIPISPLHLYISFRACYELPEAVLEHEGEEGEDVEAFDGFWQTFIIFSQAAEARGPRKRAFHHPPLGE